MPVLPSAHVKIMSEAPVKISLSYVNAPVMWLN